MQFVCTFFLTYAFLMTFERTLEKVNTQKMVMNLAGVTEPHAPGCAFARPILEPQVRKR